MNDNKINDPEEVHMLEKDITEEHIQGSESVCNENVSKISERNVDEIKLKEVPFHNNTCNSENNTNVINETNVNLIIQELEAKCNLLEIEKKQMEAKLDNALYQKETAIKEKEAMVIRYANSEKQVLKERQLKEQSEKKNKDYIRESEILQHKVQVMVSEKARICQLLDDKCYECKTANQEIEKLKADISALETKVKWSQNSLKTEIESHKKSQENVESLTGKLQEITSNIEQIKKDAQDSICLFQTSQENRAYVLDKQLKEHQANLILLKHDRDDKDQQLKILHIQLDKLQNKQKEILKENNELSIKVQQLERDRLEYEQKLSHFRACLDEQKQKSADLVDKNSQIDQLRIQLKTEQDQLIACNEKIVDLKDRNAEFESDIIACRERESELLLFTQQLTDKNVRLQSEFTALETKVQQLTCEQTLLKRSIKEQETRANMLSTQLTEEKIKNSKEIEYLNKKLEEVSQSCKKYKQEASDQRGENIVIKRKLDLSFREVSKELQQCRKKLELYESIGNTSNSSSNSSLNVGERSNETLLKEQVVHPTEEIDKQALIDHIVKLHRINAKKSEKIDFLEEHVNTLVAELQKKTHLLQNYILRDQSGALTSNSMDSNKAKLAKTNGIMASVYSSRVADNNLTLELSLDINRKLQAVLEDVLLKNITLKENVDTLGKEIDRLNKLMKT